MRLLITLAGILLSFMATPCATAAAATFQPGRVAIHVQEGDWGTARPQDIEAVLGSVASELLRFFPYKQLSPILVAHDVTGPRVLFEKSAQGEYLVYLSVKDTRWDQFTYQFSHELCHILSNHAHRDIAAQGVARVNQWFEEAVCETVSLLSLGWVASSWEQSPPYPNWREYASAFQKYSARLLSREHRRLAPGLTLADWFRENQADLRGNPYLRDKNELVASALLEVFRRNPEHLGAVGYLNEDLAATSASFPEYLASWYRCCPVAHQGVVLQAMALFGIPNGIAPAALAAAPASAGAVGNR